ncbi:MAG: UDP-N-acetylmuramoyl-L-alanine--D-glutamate ligase [Chlorobium sp.]|uniref:UDP-N-acetylmuramoyl-L-alanine--D-glutamate ligase n=1 Tax=Chlorobium sp. TaxID=1095 RepID=UPI0025B81CB0|nr:UDP-N-acetylmuramoyl-L-alanine--D-glutamate ligase [Chlorobium sp.]MCF8382199.1 UDP-N-acetylmuramoyl-L-alanine--D-glutamate ligase [Chlorobium sp.]
MDVKGKKVSVIGAKRSGLAVADLLAAGGATVFVSELGQLSSAQAERLAARGIAWEEEGHSGRVSDADFCVVSPGIPRTAEVVRQVLSQGIPLFSEIEVASWFCRARVVGITGTDGKTTTATLMHRIAEADGAVKGYRAFSAGNIGVPFSSLAADMAPHDLAVVELSSYQLEGCESFRPDVSIITNITPDHLDRYNGDMGAYAAAKYRIYASQGATDTLVYNYDDPLLRKHFQAGRSGFPFRIVPFGVGEEVIRSGAAEAFFFEDGVISRWNSGTACPVIAGSEFLKSSFRGRHNICNVLAAVAASDALGISRDALRSALSGFSGVEHRQEFVRSLDGVDWINDSKATNINALLQALNAVPGRIVLIAGGRDKGNDYSVLVPVVHRKVAAVIAIGESREKIGQAFGGITPTVQAESLEQAVDLARKRAGAGETVLFSPGCASFDMFENFEERGRLFKHYTCALES